MTCPLRKQMSVWKNKQLQGWQLTHHNLCVCVGGGVSFPPSSQYSTAPCGVCAISAWIVHLHLCSAVMNRRAHTRLIRENILSSYLNDSGIFRRAHVIFKLLPLYAALSLLGLSSQVNLRSLKCSNFPTQAMSNIILVQSW